MTEEASTERFVHEELVLCFTTRGSRAKLDWIGASDARDPGVRLRPFLTHVASRCVGRVTTIEFRRLQYMSSATVSVLVALVRELDQLEVQSILVYDASVEWQRVKFGSIRAIAKTLPRIEVRPG